MPVAAALALAASAIASPFATRVIAYDPAPGQQVRSAFFNDPARALGPPGTAGGLLAPDNTKVVTLGGFGGSITLGFDRSIWRNRFNPFAVDFTIFGNAFFPSGDPTRRFAECGVVEVSRDDNNNGLADDQWFLIPGSSLATPIARTSITYNSVTLNPTWVPIGRTGTWSMSGYRLLGPPFAAGPVLVNPNTDNNEQVWGYADLMPTVVLGDTDLDDIADDLAATPNSFYTVPDDPYVIGITPGSGGGSAIAIAWAVNPSTGAPANLDRIDFVRITTGVDLIAGLLGEVSAEVSSVADVAPRYTPDWNLNGSITVDDIFEFLNSFFAGVGEAGGADFDNSGATTIDDIFSFLNAWFTGP